MQIMAAAHHLRYKWLLSLSIWFWWLLTWTPAFCTLELHVPCCLTWVFALRLHWQVNLTVSTSFTFWYLCGASALLFCIWRHLLWVLGIYYSIEIGFVYVCFVEAGWLQDFNVLHCVQQPVLAWWQPPCTPSICATFCIFVPRSLCILETQQVPEFFKLLNVYSGCAHVLLYDNAWHFVRLLFTCYVHGTNFPGVLDRLWRSLSCCDTWWFDVKGTTIGLKPLHCFTCSVAAAIQSAQAHTYSNTCQPDGTQPQTKKICTDAKTPHCKHGQSSEWTRKKPPYRYKAKSDNVQRTTHQWLGVGDKSSLPLFIKVLAELLTSRPCW